MDARAALIISVCLAQMAGCGCDSTTVNPGGGEGGTNGDASVGGSGGSVAGSGGSVAGSGGSVAGSGGSVAGSGGSVAGSGGVTGGVGGSEAGSGGDAGTTKKRAALVDLDTDEITVFPSTGTSFLPGVKWLNVPVFGNVTNVIADVDGDGRGDLIAVPNGWEVYVAKNVGGAFGGLGSGKWTEGVYNGTATTLVGDISGDGKADLVAVDAAQVRARLSNGSQFAAESVWASFAVVGTRATLLADMNGDGKRDIIAVNDATINVALSTGASFASPTEWGNGGCYGDKATVAGDLDADGHDDLIAINSTQETYVKFNGGSGLGSTTKATASAFFGTVTTLVADVTGDGRVDLIAVDLDKVRVAIGTGLKTSGAVFNSATDWFTGSAAGSAFTIAGVVE